MRFKKLLKRAFILSKLVLAFMIPVHGWAELDDRLAKVAIPPDTRLAWVSRQTSMNGLPVSIATFYSSQPIVSTIDFYRSQWSDDDSEQQELIEVSEGDWIYLSRFAHGVNTVIQLHQEFPLISSGYLSVMDVAAATGNSFRNGRQNRSSVDSLSQSIIYDNPGSNLLASVSSHDSGSSSTISLLESNENFRSFARRWQFSRYSEDWRNLLNEPSETDHVIIMQRGKVRLEAVFSEASSGGTIAVINEVENENN